MHHNPFLTRYFIINCQRIALNYVSFHFQRQRHHAWVQRRILFRMSVFSSQIKLVFVLSRGKGSKLLYLYKWIRIYSYIIRFNFFIVSSSNVLFSLKRLIDYHFMAYIVLWNDTILPTFMASSAFYWLRLSYHDVGFQSKRNHEQTSSMS